MSSAAPNPAAGEILKRNGTSRESVARLTRKAAEAEAKLGIHGISVTASDPVDPTSQALRLEVEKYFRVHDTPRPHDSLHRTVELPKPVTQEIADRFNQLFGRRPK